METYINRWIDTYCNGQTFMRYKIEKLKNPGLDIPEHEAQLQSSTNSSNQEMPPSPPCQCRKRNNAPPSANSNSKILEAFRTLNLKSCATKT